MTKYFSKQHKDCCHHAKPKLLFSAATASRAGTFLISPLFFFFFCILQRVANWTLRMRGTFLSAAYSKMWISGRKGQTDDA